MPFLSRTFSPGRCRLDCRRGGLKRISSSSHPRSFRRLAESRDGTISALAHPKRLSASDWAVETLIDYTNTFGGNPYSGLCNQEKGKWNGAFQLRRVAVWGKLE